MAVKIINDELKTLIKEYKEIEKNIPIKLKKKIREQKILLPVKCYSKYNLTDEEINILENFKITSDKISLKISNKKHRF